MQIAILAPAPNSPAFEIAATIQRVGMEPLDFSWGAPVETLNKADAYVLLSDSPADWSASNTEALSPLLQIQNRRGKPILGLGYGSATLLADQGFIPGLFKNMSGLSLVKGESASTEAWIRLSPDYQYNAFTQVFPSQLLLPVSLTTPARFVIPPGLLAEIEAQGLNVFQYCSPEGQLLRDIAALSNKAGTVMALLPYPVKNPAGDLLFLSLRTHLETGYLESVEPMYYWPRK